MSEQAQREDLEQLFGLLIDLIDHHQDECQRGAACEYVGEVLAQLRTVEKDMGMPAPLRKGR